MSKFLKISAEIPAVITVIRVDLDLQGWEEIDIFAHK